MRAPMPVVTLARLVVVAQHANLLHHIGQRVLEGVRAAPHRRRNTPHHQVGKRITAHHHAPSHHKLCLHVVNTDNTLRCCQREQHGGDARAVALIAGSRNALTTTPDLIRRPPTRIKCDSAQTPLAPPRSAAHIYLAI